MAEFTLDKEYAKNTGISPDDVSKFRAWVRTQPHLPEQHLTDLDLILTLHCCNRSTEVAKQVLDLNLTVKTLFVNFFKDRILNQRLYNAVDNALLLPLKERTPEGYAVLYSHLLDSNPKNFIFMDAVRALFMVLDVWQHLEGSWPGFVILIDMKQVTLGHLARLDLQTLQQFLYFLQEGLLVKLKSLHFLNAPSFMDRLMMMLKPFLKKALMDVLHIHQIGSNTLDPYIPKTILPKEAGGEYLSYKDGAAEIIRMLKSCEQFLIDENKKRVTESKRPGKPKTISDIFGGVEGSFKKLDID